MMQDNRHELAEELVRQAEELLEDPKAKRRAENDWFFALWV